MPLFVVVVALLRPELVCAGVLNPDISVNKALVGIGRASCRERVYVLV